MAPSVEGQLIADRVNHFFRQRVTGAEVDLAGRNLAADLEIHGVVSGVLPSRHAPVADLTAPGRAYDNLGQRVFFGTGRIGYSNHESAPQVFKH